MITTVIFDLDDTLYDEADYCRSGFRAVAEFVAGKTAKYSAEDIFNCLWGQFATGNRKRTFNSAFEELEIDCDDKFVAQCVKVYREHKPDIKLDATSSIVLEELEGKYKLALLTDGFLPAQKLKVEALGIEKFFQFILYTEELGREFWKPSTAGFEKIMVYFAQEPEKIVYVADNEKKDFIGPNNLRFATIQVIRENRVHTEPADSEQAKAKYVIYDIGQLPVFLAQI